MSCNDNHHFSKVNCVCDVVQMIAEIQDVSTDFSCTSNCLNPVLGTSNQNGMRPNTRVFSLYTSEGERFEVDFFINGCEPDSSPFFRVESVDDCCAVLRVLRLVNEGNMAMCKFEATAQCIIVDLNCFCAIACIEDTFVSGV
ncbi:CotY/CotZ family spore coat protein [Ectobacillus panaciterrae]|uniref:CotY/CotZ family spore coat protein n=1 Tax=Ectobacillus panaciterrae TaxID=363872 RepID=UPI00048BDC7D|nr:CotY/CotZ family spore coat protein [Ectobacillus panaciterrae]